MFTTLFWKKAWTWLKHYWYFPVIILLLIFGTVAGRSSRRKLFGLLEKQKENYEKEIQVVKEAAKEVSESKTKVAEEFVEEIKLIEEEHEVKIEDLEKEKQEELKETIKEKKEKPEDLAREVAKILSSRYYEKNR